MSFFSFFEKPKPSNAFSFDDGHIRFVSLSRVEGVIHVDRFSSENLNGILDDTDTVVDEAKFVARVSALAANYGITESNIVIPDGRAVCFHTHVPKVPERQMNDVIIDHLKTYCQANDLLHLHQYISEYEVILETEFGYDIHATLVPSSYVAHLVRLFKQAGIIVPHIETAHHAVARACLQIPTGTGYVAISIGKKKTTVSVINGEHLVSHDIVSCGIETIYETVQKYLDVPRERAVSIIGKHGMLKTHPDPGLLSELYLQMSPIWQSVDRQLIELGQMPYKIYGHRFITDTMVIYGEGITIKGLIAYLGEHTNLRARELDIWAGRHSERAPILNLPASETPVYAEALALALVYLK